MVTVLNAQKKKTIFIKTKSKKVQLKRFNMTSQEKAYEIISKYVSLFVYGTNIFDNIKVPEIRKLIKDCSLITVHQLYMNDIEGSEYWLEVKNEIEKLN